MKSKTTRYTNEELILQLQQFYSKNGFVPPLKKLTQYDSELAHGNTFERRFGSFNNALTIANIPTRSSGNPSHSVHCVKCDKLITIHDNVYNKSKTKRFFCSNSCACSYNNTNKQYGTRRSKFEKYVQDQLIIDFPMLEIVYNNKELIGSELDIFIPSLKLAIELNGIVHYEPIYGTDKLSRIQNNDKQKSIRCYELGFEFAVIDTSKCSYHKHYPNYYLHIKQVIESCL